MSKDNNYKKRSSIFFNSLEVEKNVIKLIFTILAFASLLFLLGIIIVLFKESLPIFKEVKLPSALPQFFSGLKIAATYSITGAVVGEWLGAKSGIGIFMTRSIASHRADMLFAAVTVVVILSIGIFKIVEIAERIIIPWNKNS